MLASNVRLLPFPPKGRTFLYLVLHHLLQASSPIHIRHLLFWVPDFQFPPDSVLGELLTLVDDFFFFNFSVAHLSSFEKQCFRHRNFNYIHHPCMSLYLAREVDTCFVVLRLWNAPSSDAYIAYLTMLTPFSAMSFFYA